MICLNKKGSVLLLTFIIMTAVLSISLFFLDMIIIDTKTSGYDLNGSKAFWIAEAGLAQVIYNLKTSSDYRENPTTVISSFGQGTYSVDVTKNGNVYTIVSTGNVFGLSRQVSEGFEIKEISVSDAFNYLIYINGNVNLGKTDGGIVEGNIAANGNVNIRSGWSQEGELLPDYEVEIPEVDFDAYEEYILNEYGSGNIITGNYTFQDELNYEGLYYITGNVRFDENVIIDGGIVAEGNVNFNNSQEVTFNTLSGFPSLVTQGNINVHQADDLAIVSNGVFYTLGNLNVSNTEGLYFKGSIISAGNVNVSNTEDISFIYDPEILDNPPLFFSGETTVDITSQNDWNEL